MAHRSTLTAGRAIDEVQDQRQRREELVVLGQMLADDRIILGRHAHAMKLLRPFDEHPLRLITEAEPGKLCHLVRWRRTPFGGIELGQLVEHVKGCIARRLVGQPIAPLPGARVGVHEQLKTLQHPVVGQRVRRLLEVDHQFVGLNAAEDCEA